MGEVIRVKLRRIFVLKLSLVFLFIGIIFGLISGVISFIFIDALSSQLKISIPSSGSLLLSFLVIPLACTFVFWITGLIGGLFSNLFLWLSRGLDMRLEEVEEQVKK